MGIGEWTGERKRTDKAGSLGSVVLARAAQRLNLELGALEFTDFQFAILVPS